MNKSFRAETLGFSISCYKGDLTLLRGCLSSIRYFAPDAPICLIADGRFSTLSLERVYGVQVIRKDDVKNPDLREWSFGFGLTKMVAFWESPFDVVFHIDADTILWGDIRRNLPEEKWDVVYNEPHEIINEHIQNNQYFDPRQIFNFIDPFPWEGNPYFQAGVICIRRGVLDLDEYMRMLEGQRRYPGIFVNGDQGMLNILVFRAVTKGRLTAKPAHLQTVIPVVETGKLEKLFRIVDGLPLVVGRPTILHWAGTKPWSENKEIFRQPMDYFRVRGLRECGVPCYVPPRIATTADEFMTRMWSKYVCNIKNSLKKMIVRV